MEKVYLIIFEYSTEDCSGIDTYLYSTKEKAVKKLKELIKIEKEFCKQEYSHLNKNEYEIDTNINNKNASEYWWNIHCKTDLVFTYIHRFKNKGD